MVVVEGVVAAVVVLEVDVRWLNNEATRRRGDADAEEEEEEVVKFDSST
jgi:hypothetical protein